LNEFGTQLNELQVSHAQLHVAIFNSPLLSSAEVNELKEKLDAHQARLEKCSDMVVTSARSRGKVQLGLGRKSELKAGEAQEELKTRWTKINDKILELKRMHG
jgi:hypothetical protein